MSCLCFFMPFNMVMLVFWTWLGGWWRERIFKPIAGGLRISHKLANWPDKMKAEAFTNWLRQRLGFSNAQPEEASS